MAFWFCPISSRNISIFRDLPSFFRGVDTLLGLHETWWQSPLENMAGFQPCLMPCWIFLDWLPIAYPWLLWLQNMSTSSSIHENFLVPPSCPLIYFTSVASVEAQQVMLRILWWKRLRSMSKSRAMARRGGSWRWLVVPPRNVRFWAEVGIIPFLSI